MEVYIVESRYFDETDIEGVYRDKETAEKAVEKSDESYKYGIREFEVKDFPVSHEPYF